MYLLIEIGDLLVKLGDHLDAGIDLIRGGHGHATLGLGGCRRGGHGHAAALCQGALVPALDAAALGLFDTTALALELRDLPLQLLEGGTLLLKLRAKDPKALVPCFDFLVELDAIGMADQASAALMDGRLLIHIPIFIGTVVD